MCCSTRSASRVRGAGYGVPVGDDAGWVILENDSGHRGRAELFVYPAGLGLGDPDEQDVVHELDVKWVGARFDPPGH